MVIYKKNCDKQKHFLKQGDVVFHIFWLVKCVVVLKCILMHPHSQTHIF